MGVQQQVVSLDEAFARAQRGNLIYPEILARLVLARDPTSLAALNLLGFVAARAGLIDQAHGILKQAEAAWPTSGVGATVARLESMLPAWHQGRAQRTAQTRYLLIKAWGFGFCSDLGSLMGSLLLAELSGRTPVVHWGKNSLYSDGADGDSFRHFFQPLNDMTIERLKPIAKQGVFPGKWAGRNLTTEEFQKLDGADARLGGLYFLEREEPVAVFDFNCNIVDMAGWIPADHPYYGLGVAEIYRTLWAKYFKPTPRVAEAVERFAAAHWPEGYVLAVHVRDGDHRYEQTGLLDVNAQYFDAIDRKIAERPDLSIYLMTDTATVLDAFKARYGDRIFATDAQRTTDDTGIHYSPTVDKVQAGIDVLSDVLLATRADAFIGNGRSNPSCTVWQLKDWGDAAQMIVPSFHEDRNVFLYDY